MTSKSTPLVSIVIPVFNREVLIKRAIESAISQTYKNIEIIIIDNKSTDLTVQIVESYKSIDTRIKLFKNNENIGPVNNWIEGIRKASGEYIKLIFSDDWISNDYIEKTVIHFDNTIGLIFTPAIIHKIKADKQYFKLFDKSRLVDSKLFLKYSLLTFKTPLSPGCGLFRKDDLLEILSIKINIKKHQDYLRYGAGIDVLIYLMIAEKYNEVFFVHDTNAHFLEHQGSFTYANSLDKFYIEAFQFFIIRSRKVKVKFLYLILHRLRFYKIIGYFSNKLL